MRFSTITAFSILSASLASANSHVSPPHRRHLEKSNIAGRYAAKLSVRAGGPISNETQEAISAAADGSSTVDQGSTSATFSAVSTSAGSESGAAGDIITPSTSSSASSTTTTTMQSTIDTDTTVTSATQDQAVVSSPVASPAVISSAAPSSIVDTAPETILVSSASARLTSTVVRTPQSFVTATRTASSSSTASVGLANDATTKKIGSLSMTAFIAIVVVGSVAGLGVLGVFAIRKWKLRPSNRFDRRMKPIDFSPHNDGMNDNFLEKTLHRSGSRSSADIQRQQFVKDLETEPNYVAGVPEHDFTAVSNHAGYGTYGDDTYHYDPFAHAQAFEYDQGYYRNDAHGYPPAPDHQHVDYQSHEYPTQDQPAEGYADLQRGNSNGSDHAPRQQVYPNDFPSPDNYIGRPTGGADGPYAQAAQYRGY